MLLRRRLALVALLLVALGGSLVGGVPRPTTGGQVLGQSGLVGPAALANGRTVATLPKGAEGRAVSSTSSKRDARSFLLAAVGAALGLVLVRRRRRRDGAPGGTPLVDLVTRATRAPPVLAPTTT
jgi:hypothetical protein